MHCRRTLSRKELTLRDLIVVLVLLIAVGWVLMPAWPGGGREYARSAVCKSNLKNIGLCGAMYAEEHKDMWPHYHTGDSPAEARDADELILMWDAYITDPALLYCPSVTTEAKCGTDTSFKRPMVYNISYSYNGAGPAHKDSICRSPVAGDLWNGGSNPGWRTRRRPTATGKLPDSNHDAGINLLFGDGHIEWVSAGKGAGPVLVGEDNVHAAAEGAWTGEVPDTILYGSDGTIDDIPEKR